MNKSESIAKIISGAKKTTPAKVYIKGNLDKLKTDNQPFKYYTGRDFLMLIGDWPDIEKFLRKNKNNIKEKHVEITARYSALPMKNLTEVESRIEPGAIIREGAEIGVDCIIMMGAVINIGAVVGDRTMIDMNAVVGARAIIGSDSHIGAGAILAGVLEPPSADPVTVGNSALVGANAVILEGVKIGDESIVAAGSIVLEDVPEGKVVAGTPARIIKSSSEVDDNKKSILKELRNR